MKLRHLVAALLAVVILSGVRGIKPPDHWSQPRLFRGTVLEATYIPSPIQSITAISIPFVGGQLTQTQPVTVTAANSLLIFAGQTSDTVPPESAWLNGVITNGTTITASRINSGSNVTYNATLVEFLGIFVKSANHDVISMADTVASGPATLSPSVNTAKTILAYTGATSTVTSVSSLTPNNAQFTRLTLTNASTVTANRNVPSGQALVGFNYVEFK